jgi:hypothetical protein
VFLWQIDPWIPEACFYDQRANCAAVLGVVTKRGILACCNASHTLPASHPLTLPINVPDHICLLAHQELVKQRKTPIPGSYFDAGCLHWTVQTVAPDLRAHGIKTPRCEGANSPRNRA